MRIEWNRVESLPSGETLGHGVQFLVQSEGSGTILIAWLPGFTWLHDDPDELEIMSSAEHEGLAPPEFRAAVEAAIRSKQLREFGVREICDGVSVLFNA